MGFSPTLFSYFIDGKKNILNLNDVAVLDNSGENIIGIKSPTVLEIAKSHFNCPYIQSVSLENEGGEGSVGAHWERNILMNEMMTASEITSSRISIFTLALMQDSGWYTSNFDFAENFTYWKNVGCKYNFDLDFTALLEGEGSLDGVEWMPKECEVSGAKGCFYDYTHQSLCYEDVFMGNGNDSRFESFYESKFRFFSRPSDSCVDKNIKKNGVLFGESYGSDQRCFVGKFDRVG